MSRFALAAPLALLLLVTGCASHPDAADVAHGYREIGTASFISKWHAGRRTASGEPYDPDALTAAHRTLPFGTRLLVINQANGRSVVVRVNDRGPKSTSRLLDLSRCAADRLDMVADGTARVSVRALN